MRHVGQSAWQNEESGVGNIYYGATIACVGVPPPLTDMEQGIRDLGFARAAEWENESRVQQDVIRTEWHGQKSRLRGYELVTGQVSGCAERSSGKQARWHVADSNSIYMDACNAPSRWIKLSKIVDCSFFHYIAVKRKLRRKDRVLQINNNNNNKNN